MQTEGVPRLVTARKEGRNDTLVRRGLAMMIEHGFYKTEQGRKHYALNLNQIAASARLTTYAGVIEALLSGRNHYREWMRNHGPPETGERTKEYQRQNWACVNKNEKGIFLMAAEAKYQLQREGVVPDTIVLPPRMGMYAKWAHERLSYRESGPKADATLYGEALSMTRILGRFCLYLSFAFCISLLTPPQAAISLRPRHLMWTSAPLRSTSCRDRGSAESIWTLDPRMVETESGKSIQPSQINLKM